MENEKGFKPRFDDYKKENTIHVSKENKNKNGTAYRKIELLINQDENYLSEKNKEQSSRPVEFSIKDSIILHRSRGGQQKIHCWLMESSDYRRISAIRISRRTSKGVYGSEEVILMPDAVFYLKEFLNKIAFIDTSKKNKFDLPLSIDDELSSKMISEEEFTNLIKANVKNTDDFYALLSFQKMQIATKQLKKIIEGDYINEVAIQKFLKKNIWMFGNDYVFVVENNKINTKNILDLMPKNLESFVDIIEVKLPNEKLFNLDKSHNNYYPTSNLTKAISQTQNYIFELENKSNDKEYQQLNNCRIVKPRGVILFGTVDKLKTEENKYLRILNSSHHNIHILTYQQLYEKARNTLSYYKNLKEL